MTQEILARFQFRHGTAAQWVASNEVLLADEGGHESDTGKLKIGDGVTAWNSLAYFGGDATQYFPLTTAGNLTLSAALHKNKLLLQTGGTITAPPTAAAGFSVGDSLKVRMQTADLITFSETGTAEIDYNTDIYLPVMRQRKDVVELKVIAVDLWAIIGVLAVPTTMSLTGTYAAAAENVLYSSDLSIIGGETPYLNPTVVSGALPPGLTLSIAGSNLRLSGTPTASATYAFTVSVDSHDGQTAVSAPQSVVVGAATWFTTVMADSPYAFYRMDDNAASRTMVDASGNGHNGTYNQNSSTLTTPGLLTTDTNAAVLFSAATTGAQAASGIVSNADWTVEAIIKPTAATSDGVGGIWAQAPAQFAPSVDVEDQGSGKFHLRVMEQSFSKIFQSAGSWNYGTRLVWMLTYKVSTGALNLYVNGILDSTANNIYNGVAPGTGIGYNFVNNVDSFVGVVDEVSIYSACLTAARAAAHYAVA